MPVYEYKCPKCWKDSGIFEITVRVHDRNNVRCPKCDSLCELQVSKTSFILKGDGWARDNYDKK